uniref:Uncharacterized protein n=1 Tax=Branchiostoma floridae TaxID=7739 RepID=C3Z722_BRAFL|eukprot:XP_002595606.1 hypothetical protein BRAFLDRAFT_117513 [Branchiostoma floridae]
MNLRSGKSVDSVLDREQTKRKANRARPTPAESQCEEQQLLLQVVVAVALIFIGLVLYVEWNNLWFGRTTAQNLALMAPVPSDKAKTGYTLPSSGSTAEDYARIIEALIEHHPQSVRPFVEAMGKDLLKEVATELIRKDASLLELLSEAMNLPPDAEGQCSFRVTGSVPGEIEVWCVEGPSIGTVNHQEL